MAHPLRGLSLAWEARTGDGAGRPGLLAELDEVLRWLAARAADAPDNFLHLLRLVEAERAWTLGDFRAAAPAFDAARREVSLRQRPWHRALIAERGAPASTSPMAWNRRATTCSPRRAGNTWPGARPPRSARVEAVGGSMTVHSPPGAVTVLTVLLPVTPGAH
jgi:hypothetical protein